MLIQQIKADSLQARKAREADKATLLVTLLAEASRPGKDAGNRDSTDAEVVKVVTKFIKGIEDSLAVLTDPQAVSLAKQEKAWLEAYMPQQLSNDELAKVIADIVSTLADKSPKGLGALMAELKAKYSGRYSGTDASRIAKELLK